jgi:hexulose-6-phosphate isomerase
MFKRSVNYWSFENKPIAQAAREAAAAGFEALELCVADKGELTPKTSEKKVRQLAAEVRAAGIEVASLATGLFWSYPATSAKKSVQAKALMVIKSMLQIAKWAGTDAILVVPGAVGVSFIQGVEPVQYDVALKRSRDVIRRAVPLAEKLKVRIGIENVWNMMLLSPLEMRDYVDSFGSRWVGAYFDTGNVVVNGYPEHWIRILGSRICRIHIKDFKRSVGNIDGFCPLLEGDANFREVIKALKEVKYKGRYLTTEMVPTPLNVTCKALKKIIGA